MNPNKKPRLLYSFSYSIPAENTVRAKVNALEELKEDLVEQLLAQSDSAEAKAVIARIKAM
jgi:hypothetical protein